jgi:hypothetical protein
MEQANNEPKYNVYSKNNQFRKTNLTRIQAIEHFNKLKNILKQSEKDIIVYCSTYDYYPSQSSTFFKSFLIPDSKLAIIHFDKKGMLLENTLRGLKYKVDGNIVFINERNNTIETIIN